MLRLGMVLFWRGRGTGNTTRGVSKYLLRRRWRSRDSPIGGLGDRWNVRLRVEPGKPSSLRVWCGQVEVFPSVVGPVRVTGVFLVRTPIPCTLFGGSRLRSGSFINASPREGCRPEIQSLGFSLYSDRSPALCNVTLQRIVPFVFPAPASCPHRFAKLHEDCSRSLPPLRRERRFALQSSLMDPGVAVNREPAHSRIRASHTRLPCISLSLLVETVRAFGQLWAP